MIKFENGDKSFTVYQLPVLCGSESSKIWKQLKKEQNGKGHFVLSSLKPKECDRIETNYLIKQALNQV